MIFEYNRSDGGQFKCRMQCMRCTGLLRNGERCPVMTCEHLPFCAQHLRERGLEVKDVVFHKDKEYYKEEGIRGKGLFATRAFEVGEVLSEYTSAPGQEPFGEIITEQQLNDRYGAGDYDYGPYAIYDEDSQKHGDAACSRSAAAYANDSSTHTKQSDRKPYLSQNPNNSKFFFINGQFQLRAIRPIKAGSEILCDYGIKYWKGVKATIPRKMIKSGERRYTSYETRPAADEDEPVVSEWWGHKDEPSSVDSYDDLLIGTRKGPSPRTLKHEAASRITRAVRKVGDKRNLRKERKTQKHVSKQSTRKSPRDEESSAQKFVEEFVAFRGFLRSLSGVKDMFMMTKGDQKILLIGEIHVDEFCNKYNYRPLAQFIEEILEHSEHPLDFMLEVENFSPSYSPEEISDAREITRSEHSRPNQHSREKESSSNINLLRTLVRQYMPHEKANKLKKNYEVKVLPNARVQWLEAQFIYAIYDRDTVLTQGENLIDAFRSFNFWFPDDMDFTEKNEYLEKDLKKITTIIGFTEDSFTTDALFLQSSEDIKKNFLRKIMRALESTKFFHNCLVGSRRLTSRDYYKCVLDKFNRLGRSVQKSPRFYFVFYVQRFLMDVFAVCRIVKKDPRWYKNVVVYAGMAHIDNISYMLQENFYKRREIPELLKKRLDIRFNPRCSEAVERTAP